MIDSSEMKVKKQSSKNGINIIKKPRWSFVFYNNILILSFREKCHDLVNIASLPDVVIWKWQNGKCTDN